MEAAILSALSRDQNENWLIKSIRINLFLLIHYIYILLNIRDTNHQFNNYHGLQQVIFDIFDYEFMMSFSQPRSGLKF